MFLVAYLLLGRLVIWAISIAKPTRWLWSFFEGCDFCLGMWVYFVLAFMFVPQLTDFWAPIMWVPYLSEFFSGLLAAFVMHIIVIGFNAKFNEVHV